jgi:hypothetical protein
MVITSGDNYVGMAEPQLREKIATLYGEVNSYPGKPSVAQIESMKVLNEKLNDVKSAVAGITEQSEKINKVLYQNKASSKLEFRSRESFLLED